MKSDLAIIKKFKSDFRTDTAGLVKQYDNTRETQAFYAGDFMNYKDQIQFNVTSGSKKRALVQFNKVKPYVNAVKGFMAQNRRTVKYTAQIDNDQLQMLYSQYCNALKDYVRAKANADQVETQQDGDMLTCGYGAIETAMTYGDGHASTDPNGQIIMGRLDPLMVCWDSFAKAPNLTDARRVFYQRDYALDEAMDLFDDHDEQHFDEADDHNLGEDKGYVYYERGGAYNQIKESSVEWSDEKNKMVKVYFYQWYEFENYYRADNPIKNLVNPQSQMLAQQELEAIAQEANDRSDEDGESDIFKMEPRAEILTFDSTTKAQLDKVFGKYIEPFKYRRKVFYSAVLSGDHIFTKFKSPCQQGFSIQFKTGDYDAKNKIWTGMVNSMKEPVLYYNKALTELMFIIGSQSKGGVMVERSAVADVQEFEQQYAKTDAVIVVEDGSISGQKIQDKTRPAVPTGYENIVTLCDAAVSDVNGIDKSFLGSSENKNDTAALQSRRIKQVQSSLACYFDSGTLFQKLNGRLLLDFMRIFAENNDGGLFKIIGDDGRNQFLKISEDKLAPEYDVSLEEASTSPEEKQEKAMLITQIADKLLAVGDVQTAKTLYSIAVKYLEVGGDDMQKVMQVLMPQGDHIDPAYVQQLEQQVQKLMSEGNKAQVDKLISDGMLNMARVGEIGVKNLKTKAETAKTVEEAHQTGIENDIISTKGVEGLSGTQVRINA